MFDKILEILAAIAVAVTGAAGLTTAADNVGRGFDAHAPAAAGVLAEEMAALSERSELAADPEDVRRALGGADRSNVLPVRLRPVKRVIDHALSAGRRIGSLVRSIDRWLTPSTPLS